VESKSTCLHPILQTRRTTNVVDHGDIFVGLIFMDGVSHLPRWRLVRWAGVLLHVTPVLLSDDGFG
jgi:hypothetical protein